MAEQRKVVSPRRRMKPSRYPCLVWVVAVFLYAAPQSTTAVVDYEATILDDPLQPVWDKFDSLPRLVSNAVTAAIAPQFRTVNTKLERELRSLSNNIMSISSSLLRLEQAPPGGAPTDNIWNSVMQLYQEHIIGDTTEAVTKIERHINTQLAALETRLKAYVDSKFVPVTVSGAGGGGSSTPEGRESGGAVSPSGTLMTILENINVHVLKINEKIGGGSEGGDSCNTLVDKVSELMDISSEGGRACGGLNQETITAIGQLSEASSSFLPRDCSDKHWQQPESPSGVYETFPTLDRKAPVNAYCDMGGAGAKDTGGWTVILRRRNSTWGLINFNRTWNEYRTGFGDPGEGEWWYGLAPLHALTYRQPFEVDLLLHDIQTGFYRARYTTFRVEDEAQNYRLILNGFSGNLTHDALTSKHAGSPFSTWDKDNDSWGTGNCGQSNGGGWWFNACHFTTLTAPFPSSTDPNVKTIRWLENDWLVLDDVIMKIRPFNYAQRFNAHSVA